MNFTLAKPERTLLALAPEAIYEIFRARDRRFDGRVFVGVRSTGIYCRPVCTVRQPRFENCTFYASGAGAERAGYRPCLRCRPERAPGTIAPVDAVPRLAALTIRRIEDGGLSGGRSLNDLAAEFSVTARHLRRAVHQETGLTPVELAQTQRLLLAKLLLTDTAMTVTEAAFAAGFGSLRRFNDAFKRHYRLTPSALRRSNVAVEADAYAFDLDVRPPFDLAPLLAFWAARATPGVERVSQGWYHRTAVVDDRVGWVAIGPGARDYSVGVRIAVSLGPALTTILARIKAMLDTRADPAEIDGHLATDPLLAPLVALWPGTRVPGAFDGFECGVRTILGQQISVAAATTLAGRIAGRFGRGIVTPDPTLNRAFPTPEVMTEATVADLMGLGLTNRRAETVRAFARVVADGRVRLEPGSDPDQVRAELLAVPGIGDWTAEYLLLRAVGWPDAFPGGDLGLIRASGLNPAELRNRAEAWRPWRGYAAILLWRSLAVALIPNHPAGR